MPNVEIKHASRKLCSNGLASTMQIALLEDIQNAKYLKGLQPQISSNFRAPVKHCPKIDARGMLGNPRYKQMATTDVLTSAKTARIRHTSQDRILVTAALQFHGLRTGRT